MDAYWITMTIVNHLHLWSRIGYTLMTVMMYSDKLTPFFMVSQCQWGGLRHWVSHIRLDPNSQYLWYTHATFMFLWLHGILCSFPWKPVLKGLKGLKGSCPNPNVFASKQCQACSSHGLYQNLKQAVQTYHDQWFLKFERLSKYVQRYYEIPIRFLYWLEAFEWPCRFPWACSIETNIYIW